MSDFSEIAAVLKSFPRGDKDLGRRLVSEFSQVALCEGFSNDYTDHHLKTYVSAKLRELDENIAELMRMLDEIYADSK